MRLRNVMICLSLVFVVLMWCLVESNAQTVVTGGCTSFPCKVMEKKITGATASISNTKLNSTPLVAGAVYKISCVAAITTTGSGGTVTASCGSTLLSQDGQATQLSGGVPSNSYHVFMPTTANPDAYYKMTLGSPTGSPVLTYYVMLERLN